MSHPQTQLGEVHAKKSLQLEQYMVKEWNIILKLTSKYLVESMRNWCQEERQNYTLLIFF